MRRAVFGRDLPGCVPSGRWLGRVAGDRGVFGVSHDDWLRRPG